MPTTRRSNVRVARPARRKTIWVRSFAGNAVIPADSATPGEYRDDLLSGVTQPLGSTIGRVRGRITWTPGAYATGQACRVGLVVGAFDEAILDAGPDTNPNRDWMMFEPFIYQPPAVGTGVNVDLQWQVPQLTREIDVKAMRKLDELTSTLWLYAENAQATASAFSYDLSVLLLLP